MLDGDGVRKEGGEWVNQCARIGFKPYSIIETNFHFFTLIRVVREKELCFIKDFIHGYVLVESSSVSSDVFFFRVMAYKWSFRTTSFTRILTAWFSFGLHLPSHSWDWLQTHLQFIRHTLLTTSIFYCLWIWLSINCRWILPLMTLHYNFSKSRESWKLFPPQKNNESL